MSVRAAALVASILSLPACDGSGPPPTAPSGTAPDYSGTYSGPLDFHTAWGTSVQVQGRTEVALLGGGQVDMSDIVLAGSADARYPHGAHYPLGVVTVADDGTFSGNYTYLADECGRVDIAFRGRFSGRQLDITSVAAPKLCDPFQLRGELSK